MSDQKRSQVIIENLIGDGLNGFRNRFKSICGDDVDQLTQEVMQSLAVALVSALEGLPAAGLQLSKSGGILQRGLLQLILSGHFDLDRIKPLFKASLVETSTDEEIWNLVDVAVTESTPPPRAIASSL
ncbi:hypothetical protein DTO006G1_7009 [Penicillium roqueforti]|nr:hypothetical protein CBS147337_6845 [Penicillium roqueforti]KAI2714142.1 hypothetical protein CBS147318_6883 [Penicillium roqueforti]KAI2758189.1 hypothetical protein DTO006G1_7009 [Penicillium roqueforti]KAI3127389.1 hypothetical protein CBS147326_7179 [Penicillium roqueforti]KAI3161962.1 hypothetical protein DTO039G3_8320 [Penicillium roqueforti]